MLELRRTESVDIDVRILLPDVTEEIDVPCERQFRMVPALHQNLNPARRGKFVQFLIDLLKAQNVMIFVALGSIKCAEFTINIANIRVIDVSIDNVSNDLISPAVVGQAFRLSASFVRQRGKFLQREAVEL